MEKKIIHLLETNDYVQIDAWGQQFTTPYREHATHLTGVETFLVLKAMGDPPHIVDRIPPAGLTIV